jgi:hypothetical protein
MIAGAVIALVGSFLPWVGTNRLSTNGFDRYFWERSSSSFDLENPAIVVVIGSIIMLVLGMATLAAGRVLAITIIGIVFAVLGIVVGAGLLALMVDFADFVNIDLKIGIILQPIAPTISLIGAILATAKKRPPVSY